MTQDIDPDIAMGLAWHQVAECYMSAEELERSRATTEAYIERSTEGANKKVAGQVATKASFLQYVVLALLIVGVLCSLSVAGMTIISP